MRVKLKATGRYGTFNTCPHCRGTGRIPKGSGKWSIDHHYQDGHEYSSFPSREAAVRAYIKYDDGRTNMTLLGPDGQIYTVEKL